MEFTQRHNDLIYGALEVFLEKDSPSLVAREEDGLISFSTVLGLNGVIEREEDGSANVFLEGQKYYEIEKEVFHLLENRNEAPEVESLLEELAIIHQMELQERSKILIETIIRGLAKLIVDQKVTVGVDIQLGPVLIKNTDDMGNVKILLN
jgi:acylphosphatase